MEENVNVASLAQGRGEGIVSTYLPMKILVGNALLSIMTRNMESHATSDIHA